MITMSIISIIIIINIITIIIMDLCCQALSGLARRGGPAHGLQIRKDLAQHALLLVVEIPGLPGTRKKGGPVSCRDVSKLHVFAPIIQTELQMKLQLYAQGYTCLYHLHAHVHKELSGGYI